MYLMPLLKGHLCSLERDPFSGSYFNPRLATRAEMSLSKAKNIYARDHN